jgi:ankyrin repeat protein
LVSILFRLRRLTLTTPDCLQSFSYREQEHRHDDIHRAVETCDWLFQDPLFVRWRQSPRGQLLIKGNPGSGKSVLMKHAARSMMAQRPKELIVSHFIHGQGSELQRTSTGVFRALLNSLLGYFPAYLSKLSKTFEDREKRFGAYMADRWSWASRELQGFLEDLLIHHTQGQQITIFIDALDECGEGSARKLMACLSDLTRRAGNQQSNVKFCLSSRHYPILSLDDFPSISVEEKNSKDIAWFVIDRTRTIKPTLRRQRVQEEIMSKAQGGFQWVLLVTELVIERNISGRNVLGQIASCPSKLSDMYASLLNAGSEMEKRQATKLFRWIIFAQRPLSTQELQEALATDADMSYSSVAELRDREEWSQTQRDFERYICFISKGLVRFKSREIWEQWEESDCEAQLIHQSVAEYLLEDFLVEGEMNSACAGHFLISRSCLKYLPLIDSLGDCQQRRDQMSSEFPLGPYAVRYLFGHIRNAEEAGLVQSDLLSAINWSPQSETIGRIANVWKTLNPNNLDTPFGWPFIGTSEFHVSASLGSRSALLASLRSYRGPPHRQDMNGNTPLHIALIGDYADVVALLMDWYSMWKEPNRIERTTSDSQDLQLFDLDAQNNEGDTALDIAFVMMANTAVVKLLDMGACVQRVNQPHLLLFHAIGNKDIALIKKLIANHIDLTGAIYFAVEQDVPCEIFLELLREGASHERLEIGREHDTDQYRGSNALHLASYLGLKQKVTMLLEFGASATALDWNGQCPLQTAVNTRNFYDTDNDILKSLLRHAPSAVELQDHKGCTALDDAVQLGRIRFVRILLQEGQYSSPSPTLTRLFFEEHMIDMICEKIDTGDMGELVELEHMIEKIDIEAVDAHGRDVLWQAAANGRKAITEQLVKKHAVNINAVDVSGTSSLLVAVQNKHVDIVETLLSVRGIDVNSMDNKCESPLHAAVSNADKASVQLLLSAEGIDLSVRDREGITPLTRAVNAGNSVICAALLDRGDMSANARLLTAVSAGYTAAVKFILRKGSVDVNIRDHQGTPILSLAINNGRIGIVEALLQQQEIDINADNLSGVTPLSAAISRGNIALVKLLLQVPTIEVSSIYRPDMASSLQTILHLDPSILDLLTSADAVNNRPDTCHSLLRAATECSRWMLNKSLVSLAIATFDDERVVDQAQVTLFEAIMADDDVVVKLLLSKFEFIKNSVQMNGYSTLTLAILRGNIVIIDLLVKANMFDLNMTDRRGQSPLWVAALHLYGKTDILELLLNTKTIDVNIAPKNEPDPTILWWAANQLDKTVFKMLLATGQVHLDIPNADGDLLLHWAVKANDGAVVESLLETGKVDVNQTDSQEMTPLLLAERDGRTAIAELLQAHKQRKRSSLRTRPNV